MAKTETFAPTEIWTPNDESFELGVAIEAARREINDSRPEWLIHELKQSVKHSDAGVVYAVLKGNHPEEYSETDALVIFNPFANSATDNMLVRAEFIRRVAEKANVHDDTGKLKPVIMLASPGIHGTKLNLDKTEKARIRLGDLGPAAKEFLGAVSAQDYGRIALLGFSQGADMALSGALQAEASNLYVDNVSIGEPPGVTDRSMVRMAADFLTSNSQFNKSILSGGVDVQTFAVGKSPIGLRRDKELLRFAGAAAIPSNLNLWAAMSKNTFEQKIQQVLDDGTIDKVAVGYGTQGHVSRPEAIEPVLAKLHDDVSDNRLVSIRVEGKDHSWGDNLPLLAKLYLKALV